MRYTVKAVFDHFEIYDIQGNFLFSADTRNEISEELESMN